MLEEGGLVWRTRSLSIHDNFSYLLAVYSIANRVSLDIWIRSGGHVIGLGTKLNPKVFQT